jgi:hypothetical protein
VLCYLALAVGVALHGNRLRGSTLVGPWAWTLVALGGAILAALLPGDAAYDAARFAALMGIFCPAMSLLGAKRPQDTAWHFIVASLWGILALPALEGLVLRPGQPLAIIDFRAWFLVVLIGLNVLIYLPTRQSLAAILVGLGQVLLCWPFLPWSEAPHAPWRLLAAAGCGLAAGWWSARSPRVTGHGFDRVWLDFRDTFGTLWGARVLERVNAAAVMYDWPFRLGWSGFFSASDYQRMAEIPPEYVADLRQTMVNLLRRFVAPHWIAERLGTVEDRPMPAVERSTPPG